MNSTVSPANAAMKMVTLKCSSCGANLEITPEMEVFACGHCGTQQVVKRAGGTVSLKVLSDAIGKVQAGTDKTAAELAIKRLKEELVTLNHSYRARVFQVKNEKSNATTALLTEKGGSN